MPLSQSLIIIRQCNDYPQAFTAVFIYRGGLDVCARGTVKILQPQRAIEGEWH